MFSQWFIQKKNDKKVGFEDVIYAIQNPNLCFLINVLPSNEQGCLIIGTMPYENEEREINELLKNNKHDCIIIIYGKNSCDNKVEEKYKQLFDLYYNYMFQYYEYMHRTTPEIQYLTKMESKNLIYTQLGLPFRPKLSGWEFLDEEGNYPSLSVIDWSNDHSWMARLTRGVNVMVDKLGVPEKYIEHKLNNQRSDSSRFVTLYEFQTKY